MIIAVPFEVFVTRTARVRPDVTVTGCETTEPIRTARVRDGVVVFVTLLLLVIPATPIDVPATPIDVALFVDADGMTRLPTAREGVEPPLVRLDVTVAAPVCVAVVAPELFATITVAGLAAAVGDGTPTEDKVGVGVPVLTWFGAATPAEDTVGVGVPLLTRVGVTAVAALVTVVPPPRVTGAATIALVAMPAVAPLVVIGAFVTVVPAPPVNVMPAAPPVSLITTGVGSELIDEFTVISGFA